MIDFNNTKIAFHLKTDSELEKAYFLFKMISNQPLVKIGTLATNFALKTNLLTFIKSREILSLFSKT